MKAWTGFVRFGVGPISGLFYTWQLNFLFRSPRELIDYLNEYWFSKKTSPRSLLVMTFEIK